MNATAGVVYGFCVFLLFIKYLATALLLARERRTQGRYRYPEDAVHWHGKVVEDSDLGVRAQRLLSNDAEGQYYFVALAGICLHLGVAPGAVILCSGAYTFARIVHAAALLSGRQPLRNHAFTVGVVVLAIIALIVVNTGIHQMLTMV